MRILYVIDSMTKDGAESQLLKTLDRLPPEQYEAHIVLSRAEGERISELAEIPCGCYHVWEWRQTHKVIGKSLRTRWHRQRRGT